VDFQVQTSWPANRRHVDSDPREPPRPITCDIATPIRMVTSPSPARSTGQAAARCCWPGKSAPAPSAIEIHATGDSGRRWATRPRATASGLPAPSADTAPCASRQRSNLRRFRRLQQVRFERRSVMTKRRNAVVGGLAALSLTMVPAAWAQPPGSVTTGHDDTVTVSCTDVPSFTADQNALFGQQTETTAFNTAPRTLTPAASWSPNSRRPTEIPPALRGRRCGPARQAVGCSVGRDGVVGGTTSESASRRAPPRPGVPAYSRCSPAGGSGRTTRSRRRTRSGR
jgi:hypothetical protein